jgi:hypothetical protein
MSSVDSPTTPGSNSHDTTVLLDRGVSAIEQSAQQTRKRFLWTWLAVACLALFTGVALLLAIHTAGEQNDLAHDQADLAQHTADQAKTTADDTVKYLRGEQGIPGVPGTNGQEGTPGLPGATGEAGAQGPAGSAGQKGDTGAQGPAGSPGSTGSPGPAGTTGQAGPAGDTGAQGARGPRGLQGERGPTGPQGETGAQGPAGAQGPSGVTDTQTFVDAPQAETTATAQAGSVSCASGVVVGGGARTLPDDAAMITASYPEGNTWVARAVSAALIPWRLWTYVVCTRVAEPR